MSRWSIAVFAMNEEATIVPCLEAIERAAAGVESCITVIVNGSTDATVERVQEYRRHAPIETSVLSCPAASKANAWNSFIYDLRPEADFYFFVDAYARVEPDAFARLAEAMLEQEEAHAVTSVPTTGRGAHKVAQSIRTSGGLHGTLHMLRKSFVDEIVRRGIRQPFGLYRGDGLIGAMALSNFKATLEGWERERIAVVPERTWTHRPPSPFRLADVKRQFRRQILQARGRLESRAMGEVIRSAGFEGMPSHADAMIVDWLSRQDQEKRRSLRRDPFMRLALRRLAPTAVPAPSALRLEPCLS